MAAPFFLAAIVSPVFVCEHVPQANVAKGFPSSLALFPNLGYFLGSVGSSDFDSIDVISVRVVDITASCSGGHMRASRVYRLLFCILQTASGRVCDHTRLSSFSGFGLPTFAATLPVALFRASFTQQK